MIQIKIDEDYLLEVLVERLKYWAQDKKVIELYKAYLQDLILSGCMDGMELDVAIFIDNLYINDTKVMTTKELTENNIDVEDERVLYSQDDLYLVQAY